MKKYILSSDSDEASQLHYLIYDDEIFEIHPNFPSQKTYPCTTLNVRGMNPFTIMFIEDLLKRAKQVSKEEFDEGRNKIIKEIMKL